MDDRYGLKDALHLIDTLITKVSNDQEVFLTLLDDLVGVYESKGFPYRCESCGYVGDCDPDSKAIIKSLLSR